MLQWEGLELRIDLMSQILVVMVAVDDHTRKAGQDFHHAFDVRVLLSGIFSVCVLRVEVLEQHVTQAKAELD